MKSPHCPTGINSHTNLSRSTHPSTSNDIHVTTHSSKVSQIWPLIFEKWILFLYNICKRMQKYKINPGKIRQCCSDKTEQLQVVLQFSGQLSCPLLYYIVFLLISRCFHSQHGNFFNLSTTSILIPNFLQRSHDLAKKDQY